MILKEEQREEILDILGNRKFNPQDKIDLLSWLNNDVFSHGIIVKEAVVHSKEWLRKRKIDIPQEREFERDIASAYSEFEAKLFEQFSNGLNDFTKESILYCLNESEEEGISFHKLKADPGRIGLETVLNEIIKMKYINDCDLPFEKLHVCQDNLLAVHSPLDTIDSRDIFER